MVKVRWLMDVAVGQRVMVHSDLVAEPFYFLKAGSTGTVTFVNEQRGVCAVLMDQPFEGCEALDNEIYFNFEDAAMPESGWFTLQEVMWPIPWKEERSESH